MGWAPRTLNVTLPDKLSTLAGGVRIVTCRYLGGGQIERIQTARSVRAMERMKQAGPAFMSAIREHEERLENKQQLSKAKLAAMAQTATEKLLNEHPRTSCAPVSCARLMAWRFSVLTYRRGWTRRTLMR